MTNETSPRPFEQARAAIPSCALDDDGLRLQHERQRRLGPAVERSRRDGDRLVVEFAPDYDRRALEEMVATERECCPFFTFEFDEGARRLTVGVEDGSHAPALDAIAAAIGAR